MAKNNWLNGVTTLLVGVITPLITYLQLVGAPACTMLWSCQCGWGKYLRYLELTGCKCPKQFSSGLPMLISNIHYSLLFLDNWCGELKHSGILGYPPEITAIESQRNHNYLYIYIYTYLDLVETVGKNVKDKRFSNDSPWQTCNRQDETHPSLLVMDW